MTQSLPPRPSLEHLKKQAQSLLRAGRQRLPEALSRIVAILPGRVSPNVGDEAVPAEPTLKLADAQFVIAREYGFANWAELKWHVELAEEAAKQHTERVHRLIECCLHGELARAERLLGRFPDLATSDLYAAAALGELSTVEAMLDKNSGLVQRPGGPLNAPPLVYVCASHCAAPLNVREPKLRALAALLLQRGADPNSRWYHPDFPGSPLSVLYGACGINGNVLLAKLLLDAGATPNDNESLYHAVERGAPDCVQLLLEHGAAIAGSNAVHHAVALGHLELVRLFLSHGADVNERILAQQKMTLLHWAIDCHQPRDLLELLVEQGADLRAVSADRLTPFRRAVLCGHRAAIDLLTERGVAEPLSPEEAFLSACLSGDEPRARSLMSGSPNLFKELAPIAKSHLPGVAWRGNEAGVRTMLAVGFDVASLDERRATALHAAAWQGHVGIVQLLLEHHPPLEGKDSEFHCTPLEWALHGSRNCRPHLTGEAEATWDDAYASIVASLLAAGSARPVNRLVRLCRGRVEEVLADAGIVPDEED